MNSADAVAPRRPNNSRNNNATRRARNHNRLKNAVINASTFRRNITRNANRLRNAVVELSAPPAEPVSVNAITAPRVEPWPVANKMANNRNLPAAGAASHPQTGAHNYRKVNDKPASIKFHLGEVAEAPAIVDMPVSIQGIIAGLKIAEDKDVWEMYKAMMVKYGKYEHNVENPRLAAVYKAKEAVYKAKEKAEALEKAGIFLSDSFIEDYIEKNILSNKFKSISNDQLDRMFQKNKVEVAMGGPYITWYTLIPRQSFFNLKMLANLNIKSSITLQNQLNESTSKYFKIQQDMLASYYRQIYYIVRNTDAGAFPPRFFESVTNSAVIPFSTYIYPGTKTKIFFEEVTYFNSAVIPFSTYIYPGTKTKIINIINNAIDEDAKLARARYNDLKVIVSEFIKTL